jgi:hypothetical protein
MVAQNVRVSMGHMRAAETCVRQRGIPDGFVHERNERVLSSLPVDSAASAACDRARGGVLH